ncbi:MAG: cytochrome C oxidase subunit II [Chloroflexi bacterium]|nr:cytochrome C oxidase subunit II [Chloroflexota bacterium]
MHIDRLERYWLTAVAAMLGSFVAALVVSVTVFGIRLPSPVDRIDPQHLEETEFAEPGIRAVGGNRYEVHIVAKMWSYDAGPEAGAAGAPPVIRIPNGSQVTFYVTSRDIIHGFYIEQHSVNLEVIPGQVARASTLFNRPGTYKIICNQYCGAGHQTMYGDIIVE